MRLRVILVASMLLAGCAEADRPLSSAAGAPSSSAPPPEPAPEPVVNETAGSIAGLVTDEEARPIPGVKVTNIETRLDILTDPEGRFTMNDLAAGDYRIAFDVVGFEAAARRVTVVAGEVTELKVVLKAVALFDAPYHESIPKRAYIKNSYVFLTTFGSAANGTGALSNLCDPCIFHLHYGKRLVEAMGQAHWAKSNLDPAVNNETFLQYYVGYTATTDGTAATTGYVKNRGTLPITESGITAMAKVNSTRLRVNGGFYSVSLDHKPEIWTTFAYVEALPDGFTALPPP
ncbi:MAG: carboxypeptidase regulatory-like domain-containing protein [Euryarchaeota archaeon]|nr:carboxypeptidase regulatory-like domain-containing protein [Euryarchaeota archaeon]